LNKDNYIELSKEFEDSFNGRILVDALQDILQEDNYTLSGSDVQTIRDKLTLPDSKAFKVLQREYYQRTQTPDKFSKVSLGEFIAKVLAKKKQYVGQSKPEDIITRIHESVKKQMNF
jgi:hypothetical protein